MPRWNTKSFLGTGRILTQENNPGGIDLMSHCRFLEAMASPDGGFFGPGGSEDIYYTFFGLLCERILGKRHASIEKTAESLSRTISPDMTHLYAQIASLNMIASGTPEILDRLHRGVVTLQGDGCFRRTGEDPPSLYATFLGLMAVHELGRKITSAEKERFSSFILQNGTPDGGFSSLEGAESGMTNQTSAAVAGLDMLDMLHLIDREKVISFYRTRKESEGGYYAGKGVPMPDLLSTHSACVALCTMDAAHEIEKGPILDLVKHLQCPGGGFSGSLIDMKPDTEYTYYGLGVTEKLGTFF